MTTPVIIAEGLTKAYGKKLAVDRLDFQVNEGEIVGLLGPNGAGKTTTILMLLGLTEPTAGRAVVAGFDPLRQPLEVKRRVGYMPDAVGFYDNLSGIANLNYSARLARIPDAEVERRRKEALDRVRLADMGNVPVSAYSRGMRQRLAVAEILMKGASIAILDEPTSGLDPQSTREFLDLIQSLKRDGMAILISSHLLEQVQAVCDRVVLFKDGRIALSGRVNELLDEVLGGSHVIRIEADGTPAAERLQQIDGVVSVKEEGPGRICIEARQDVRPEIAQAIVRSGAKLRTIGLAQASLADVYARHLGEVRHAA
jgi:ABC-2 type transport system ATP-binding protein